jgi:hypothetical protein
LSSTLLALLLWAQAPVVDLDHFLGQYIGLENDEIRDVRNGRIVAKRLPSSDGREIAVFGIAKVSFTADFYRSQFRHIETLKKNRAVPEVGRFGEPPTLSDLGGLHVPQKDLEDLRRCRPEDCDLRLSADAIRRFREGIDWESDDALDDAEVLFRQMLVERARAYRRGGSTALEAYDDKDDVVPLRDDFEAILSASAYLLDYVPELVEMMRRYPDSKLDGAEDFLYWSREDIGLKPVISVTHAILYSWRHGEGEEELIIASKQLYASHYFDSSLGLTAVLEVEDEGPETSRYLVYLNRTRSLDLGGFFGGVKRSLVAGKVLDGLKTNLLYTRARLQAIYRASLAQNQE